MITVRLGDYQARLSYHVLDVYMCSIRKEKCVRKSRRKCGKKHASQYAQPVLAVAETAGLCVRLAEEAINLGPSDILLFSPAGARHIWKEGETLTLGSQFSTS